MQQKVKKGVKMVKQELKEREEVEAEINIVKSWIQETKEYLLSPDVEVDTLLQELQVFQIYQFLNYNIHLVICLWMLISSKPPQIQIRQYSLGFV